MPSIWQYERSEILRRQAARMHRTVSSARKCEEVFGIPELSEMILLELSYLDLLICQLVNHCFRTAIFSSNKVQQALFLKPIAMTIPSPDYLREWQKPIVFMHPLSYVPARLRVKDGTPWHKTEMFKDQLMTQPPFKEIQVSAADIYGGEKIYWIRGRGAGVTVEEAFQTIEPGYFPRGFFGQQYCDLFDYEDVPAYERIEPVRRVNYRECGKHFWRGIFTLKITRRPARPAWWWSHGFL